MASSDEEQPTQSNNAMNGGEEEAEPSPPMVDEKQRRKKEKRKRKLLEESKKLKRRGVCYLSRIPPKMDPLKLRHILSQYGDILRLYLVPLGPHARTNRTKRAADGFRGQDFSEGWVEFTDKHVAKRVANMLNGEQAGGKKRSRFYYDIWNIKYLSKFKWDDLTEEVAYKNAVREQKLVMEMSAAKKERDFYLSKVERSNAMSAIDERMKKKQKLQQDSGASTEKPADQQEAQPKVVRFIPQNKSVADMAGQSKPRLSKNVLAEVFNS